MGAALMADGKWGAQFVFKVRRIWGCKKAMDRSRIHGFAGWSDRSGLHDHPRTWKAWPPECVTIPCLPPARGLRGTP